MSESIPPLTRKQVAAFLSPRPRDSHKGQFGTAVVIGGAIGTVGAALLAGRAALKLGAGAVHVGLLAEGALAVDPVQPELMLHGAQDALSLLPHPDKRVKTKTGLSPRVLAVGCGMGVSIRARGILQGALQRDTALVLDADALNLLARHADLRDILRARQAPAVITPHPGEAARLLETSAAEIQADRVRAAQRLAEELHCAVALKGAGTICVARDGKTFINDTGNPGMSAPGMGDVLTGMIAAFVAQGMDVDRALLLGVHLHGAAGDALAEQGVTVGMTASEVTDWARRLLNQWLAS